MSESTSAGMAVNFGDADEKRVTEGGGGIPPIENVLCEVVGAEFRPFAGGAGMYMNYGLKVAEGEFAGKMAGYDKLFFHTEGSRSRALFVLRRLGIQFTDAQLAGEEQFNVRCEDINGRFARVTTEYEIRCNGGNCYGGAKQVATTDDGTPVYACTGDKNSEPCEWRGTDPKRWTKPTYSGYEFADPESIPAEAKTESEDLKSVPF